MTYKMIRYRVSSTPFCGINYLEVLTEKTTGFWLWKKTTREWLPLTDEYKPLGISHSKILGFKSLDDAFDIVNKKNSALKAEFHAYKTPW